MLTVEEFCHGCDTMQDIWRKSRLENTPLHPNPVRAGESGLKSLFECVDYVAVKAEPTEFDERIRAGEFILPYGGSVMYSLELHS